MTSFVFKDAKVFFGGLEVTGLTNSIALDYSAEAKDSSVLGNSTRQRLSGVATAQGSLEGFWDSTEDSAFFDTIGATTEEVITILPNGSADGDRVFFMDTLSAMYNQNFDHGEIFGFTLEVQSDGALIQGNLGMDETITIDGNSASINLGAIAADETVFAALHVIDPVGGDSTLDVIVVSDDDDTFDSASTARMTFTQVTTTAVAQLLKVAGAITDPHWRFEWDIEGSAPSYQIVGVIGKTALKNN